LVLKFCLAKSNDSCVKYGPLYRASAEPQKHMTKWTKTRRDPSRTYLDEERLQRHRRMLARVHELVKSGIEAEPEVVEAAKAANPEITEEQLKEVIMLFRDAVYSRQHDR
jgi:hypothetical protein